MATFRIYYSRPEAFRDLSLGFEFAAKYGVTVTAATLDRTHVFLREIEAADLHEVYRVSQGEIWSPNGEARELIRSKGLAHTSMSVGDVIVDAAGVAHMVEMVGFLPLPAREGAL
ncbi:MAG: hypothetical protein OEW52_00260 [Thermoleophilia bacterium]|nr:hypothetical protein [Thermoleophilia bacterium]